LSVREGFRKGEDFSKERLWKERVIGKIKRKALKFKDF